MQMSLFLTRINSAMTTASNTIKVLIILVLPSFVCASMVIYWYEWHPTESERNALARKDSMQRIIVGQAYRMNLNKDIVVIPEMLEEVEFTQVTRPKDLVQRSVTACPRRLTKSVKRGDFVRYGDFGL